MEAIEQFPLDSLILFSLREFSHGNIEIADKIHEIFQLKVKEALNEAQSCIARGNNFKADQILANITRAKIAQSEWIYLSIQDKENAKQNLKINPNITSSVLEDIYSDLANPDTDFINSQIEKLKTSYKKEIFHSTEARAKQLLVIFPEEVQFHIYLGSSQLKRGKKIQSIKTFENALKFNPNDENLLFNMGLAQLQSGFLHHAELFLRKTLIENSNHFLANKNLAEIMLDQDNFIEAEYYFKKALMIDNNDSSVYESLSICLKNQSKLGEALQFAQFAFHLSPSNSQYLNNIGMLYQNIGLYKKAEEAFRSAIKMSPKFYEAHNNLGTILQNHYPNEAIKSFLKAKSSKIFLPVVLYNLAVSYRQIGDNKNSQKSIGQSLELNPNQSDGYKLLGILQIDKGNFKGAIASFKKSIEINNFNAEVYHLLSKIYTFNVKEISRAKKVLKQINNKDKKHIYYMLAEYYAGIHDYEKSWENYNFANQLISKNIFYSLDKDVSKINKIKELYLRIYKKNINLNKSQKEILFITGMPRSGTTLIEQIISNNDCTFAGGEIDFISKNIDNFLFSQGRDLNFLDQEIDSFLKNLGNEYLKFLDLKSDKVIFTDKMPQNFLYLGIIKTLLPNSKIIHVTRNPIDNCWSLYKTYFSNNAQPFSYSQDNIINYFKLYNNLMKFWESYLPDTIYTIKYEDLVYNPENEIKKLLAFCNIKWSKDYLDFHKNKNNVYTASAFQVRNKLNSTSINSWKSYSKFLTKFKKELKYTQ